MLNFYYPVNNKLGIMFLPFLHTQKSFSFIWLFLYWLFDKNVGLEIWQNALLYTLLRFHECYHVGVQPN